MDSLDYIIAQHSMGTRAQLGIRASCLLHPLVVQEDPAVQQLCGAPVYFAASYLTAMWCHHPSLRSIG